MSEQWDKYIGLPWRRGASPRKGVAADCLLLVFEILDDLEQSHPEVNPEWFDKASQGSWRELTREFEAHSSLECSPSVGSVSMHRGGMAICIGAYVMGVDERFGVYKLPLHMVKHTDWRRFK